jgi:hypothetical protein
MKWLSEEAMVQVPWIAPIFASVGIDGWPGFPPLNWYSDNVAVTTWVRTVLYTS